MAGVSCSAATAAARSVKPDRHRDFARVKMGGWPGASIFAGARTIRLMGRKLKVRAEARLNEI